MTVQIPTTEYPSFEVLVAELLSANVPAGEDAAFLQNLYSTLPDDAARQVADAVAAKREVSKH